MRRVVFLAVAAVCLAASLPGSGSPVAAQEDPAAAGTSGPTLRALVVEGEFGALVVPNDPDLSPSAAFTIEAWIKRMDRPGCGTIISNGRALGTWFGVCDGRLRFTVRGASQADGNTVLPVGLWTHVAVTYDGVQRAYFVNGVSDGSGPLLGQLPTSNVDTRIGADADGGYFFLGNIDEVRLWNTARTGQQLRAGMLEPVTREPGLVAAWHLDGNGHDVLGEHDAKDTPPGTFSYDGALPRDLTLPLGTPNVNVDGRCDAWEYGSSERVALDMPDSPAVLILLSSSDLYVCFDDMARGNTSTAQAAVYLDRDSSKTDPASAGDYRFTVNYRGTVGVEEGDGAGNYKLITPNPGNWAGARTTTLDRWSAEFRISRSFILPPSDPEKDPTVGIAVSQVGAQPTERLWPVAAERARPSTWSEAVLGKSTGELPRFTFKGVVRLAQEKDDPRPGRGIKGAEVQLLTWDEKDTQLTLVDIDTTDGGGEYTVEYQGKDPDAFVVRALDARGTVSVEAQPGSGAESAGANVVRYDIPQNRPPQSVEYDGTVFVDVASPAALPELQQHYLIIYDAPITEGDLWPIVEAKKLQGFHVVPVSARDLARTGTGRDLGEKIFNYLKAYWDDVEPDPIYALLIGRSNIIPVRDVGWLSDDHAGPGDPDYYPRWPTDWYYADLDSGWDANGNGFYGEFLTCAPGATYTDDKGEEQDCPEAGSLAREGPFGDLRGPEDDFLAEVAVGRIPLNERSSVQRALMASVAAEDSGSDTKRRALLAGTMWSYEGASWSTADKRFVSGGAQEANSWVLRPWDGEQPLGVDSAVALNTSLRPLLAPLMDSVTTLFETTAPGGDPRLAPSNQPATGPFTAAQFEGQWTSGRNGLIFVAGNGGANGVIAAHWLQDWNFNGQIEQPAEPDACRGQVVVPNQEGPPCWELLPEVVVGGDLPVPSSAAPVVFANAGLTGNVAWDVGGLDAAGNVVGVDQAPAAIAGDILGRGAAAAWIGSYDGFEPGTLDAMQNRFATALAGGMRLGDAVWSAQTELGRRSTYDPRSYGVELFGDPAMTYWGGGADMRGAWPQSGGDWGASGQSRYSGPDTPQLAWTARDGAPSSAASVAGDGTILVAGKGAIVRLSAGGARLAQQTIPGAPPSSDIANAPAATVDGAVVATGNTVYMLDSSLSVRTQQRLQGSVSGDPRVGPDGTIWVPTSQGMARVLQTGAAETLGGGAATGPAAFLPDGGVVWSEQGGVLTTWHLNLRTGEATLKDEQVVRNGELTPPAVSATGTIYVAGTNGRLYARPLEDPGWDRGVTGTPAFRPVLGDDGTVYVATSTSMVALDGTGGAEVWTAALAGPVAAEPVVDASRVYFVSGNRLTALDRATGGTDWTLALDMAGDGRSTPIISADRTLYLLQRDNALLAFREGGWLAAPSNVTTAADGSDLTVSWRDNATNETGYLVEVCTVERKCGEAARVAANSTSARLRGLNFTPGEGFYVRVQALGQAGLTTLGRPQAGTTLAAVPEADANRDSDLTASALTALGANGPGTPASLSARPTSSEAVDLTWTYGGDAGELVGFEIGRATDQNGPFVAVGTTDPSILKFHDEGLKADTEYFYSVRAVNERGQSGPATASAQTWRRIMGAASSMSLLGAAHAVTVRWAGSPVAAQEWVIERRDPGVADYRVVGRVNQQLRSFADSLYLEPGTYGYRIKAVGDRNESPYLYGTVRFIGRNLDEATLFLPTSLTRRQN